MWWKPGNGSFEEDMLPFRDDSDAAELVMFVVGNNCDADIFCEPQPEEGGSTFMDRIREKGKGKWCKHAFPFFSKCDVLMNNLSESFNTTILLQRDKPIITML